MPPLSTLSPDKFTRLESAVSFERARRHYNAQPLSDDAMNTEVNRLLVVEAERRARYQAEFNKQVLNTIQRRLKLFESGRLLGVCGCRDCLAGYVTSDSARMCERG
jgi:hypothetical protein